MRRRSVIICAFGLLLLVADGLFARWALSVYAAFRADPACTTSIALDTPPRRGPTCVVYAGTIVKKYTSGEGSRHDRADHIVVLSDSGVRLDVHLENEFWSQVFPRATVGSHAVVESVNRFPAFIATPAGSLTATGDPRSSVFLASALLVIGVIVLGFGIRMRQTATGRHGFAGASIADDRT
jgi:hypothetical protein